MEKGGGGSRILQAPREVNGNYNHHSVLSESDWTGLLVIIFGPRRRDNAAEGKTGVEGGGRKGKSAGGTGCPAA